MDISNLAVWILGEVLIAVGVPLFFLARYLQAPEDKKQRNARALKIIAIIWMAAGVIIYLKVLLVYFIK